jgi:hypothetical protein
MIIDRNIADDANIAMHKLAIGGTVFGERFYVDYRNGSTANTDGKKKDAAFKKLSNAYDVALTNSNSVIFVDGDSAVVETAYINWSKNRIHVIGDNGFPSLEGYGLGARISIGVTTATADIAIIKNTGVRNTFQNLKFDSANTLTQAVYAFAEGGEYTRFSNCEFYKSTHLTAAAGGNLAAELLCNGDSSQWYGCTFGDLVNTRGTGGSCIRPNVLLTRETITGKVARDCSFVDCTFLVKAADTGVACVYASTATDIERRIVFKRPLFINAKLGSANPGEAILVGAAQTEGWIILIDPSTFDMSAHASASVGAYLTGGSAPVDSTTGIGAIIDT